MCACLFAPPPNASSKECSVPVRTICQPMMARLRQSCHAAIVNALTDDESTAQALDEVMRALFGDAD